MEDLFTVAISIYNHYRRVIWCMMGKIIKLDYHFRIVRTFDHSVLKIVVDLLLIATFLNTFKSLTRATWKTYIILVLILPLISNLPSGLCETKLHLPPVTSCLSEVQNQNDIVISCLNSCEKMLSGDRPKYIATYAYMGIKEKQVIRCQKTRVTCISEETWTFSKLISSCKRERMLIDQNECRAAWKDQCNQKECILKLDNWIPDYQWATSVKEIKEGVEIDSTIKYHFDYIDGSPTLYGNNQFLKDSTGYEMSTDGMSVLIWSPGVPESSVIGKECSWERQDEIDCYPNSVNNLICPSLGTTITGNELTEKKELSPDKCQLKLKMTDNGIVYRVLPDSHVPTGIVGSLPLFKVSDENKVDISVTSLMTYLKIEKQMTCYDSCYKYSPNSSTVQVVGHQIIKVEDGKVLQCSFHPFCKVAIPIKVCMGDPKLIQVVCNKRQIWWNPSTTLQSPDMTCYEGLSNLPAIIETWHGRYLINSSGIYYNDTGVPKNYPAHMRITNMELVAEHAILVKNHSWINRRSMESHKEIVKDNLNYFSFKWISNICDWIIDLSHEIKVYLIIAFTVLSICVGLFALKSVKAQPKTINTSNIAMRYSKVPRWMGSG